MIFISPLNDKCKNGVHPGTIEKYLSLYIFSDVYEQILVQKAFLKMSRHNEWNDERI